MMREYEIIRDFYGSKTAKRSLVPLINHIDEGVEILKQYNASERAIKAYCLHPIVQNDEDVDVSWSDAYDLAVEYKIKANSYLCRPDTDHISTIHDVANTVGHMSDDCVKMLLADKIQNKKDFMEYHYGSHNRSKELHKYFNLWLDFLNSYDILFK